MVKKKPFINKKAAQHFHVVHRSQRDPLANDPNASKFVLLSNDKPVEFHKEMVDEENDMTSDFSDHEDFDEEDEDDDDLPDLVAPPSSSLSKKTSKNQPRRVRFGNVVAEDLVDEFGMVRDGYDYSQHMKEMGEGQFYSASGRFESQNALSKRIDLPEDVLPSGIENDRLLEAITLTTDLMDEDLREALTNDEAFEQLDDDFMLKATAKDDTDTNDGFDYDAHIAKLMAAASGHGTPKFRGNLTDDEDEDEEDEDYCTDYEEDEEEYDKDDAVADSADEDQRLLDEMFEKTLALEYDDEQLGELEEDDPELRGDVVLEGDLLASIVEDFEHVTEEMALEEGRLGNPLRTGNQLTQIIEECAVEEEDEEYYQQVTSTTETVQMDELFESNVYLQRQEKEQWDCETIVSTYSTLDNHPTRIKEEPLHKKNKKKKQPPVLEQQPLQKDPKQIRLSKKTGMPLGVLSCIKEKDQENHSTSSNQNQHSSKKKTPTMNDLLDKKKGETKEEKKARKEAMKLLKRDRREEKKQTKQAYKEEEIRQFKEQTGQRAAANGGNVSVFKY